MMARLTPDRSIARRTEFALSRRDFLRAVGTATLAASALPHAARAVATMAAAEHPESVVQSLYESLSAEQRSEVCFPWDHLDRRRGLLRSYVSANWNITKPEVNSRFYTADQRAMVREIFDGLINSEWEDRFERKLQDDAGGFGENQSFAIFGAPGESRFEFVLTGRHMTLRCDGNSADHVAFGGPIFYGHATGTWWSGGFIEKADHPGNVFWPQAVAANGLYAMLDGKQREQALLKHRPSESRVGFLGSDATLPGISIAELSLDQRSEAQRVLGTLLDPFRMSDRDDALACLRAQGGLDACALAFYEEGDTGGDGVWDCFRLEGPAFVWYFRGAPHVHVWVNVADDPGVALNA